VKIALTTQYREDYRYWSEHDGTKAKKIDRLFAAQLIADTDGQENLVPYRWHAALYPVLAPLDDEINI
jgi:hypothetical protein